jgi:hypothetical protein
MKSILFAFTVTVAIFLLSCDRQNDQEKYQSLRASVLSHYKQDANPLKLKAARFLLDNLKDLYSIEGDRTRIFSDTILEYYQDPDTLYKKLFKIRNGYTNSVFIMDVSSLSPDYLIENIDRAFESWQNARWKHQIAFSDFCEYILPYRISHEPLENWRKEIRNDSVYKVAGDSLRTFSDIKTAAAWFYDKDLLCKNNFNFKWGDKSINLPDLPYSVLQYLSMGTCSDLNKHTLLAYRSAGFPVTEDFTPHWANNSAGHEWATVITANESLPFTVVENYWFGKYKAIDYIPSKVYRKKFSINKESHLMKRGYCSFLPVIFNNPSLIDVTNLYEKTTDIKVRLFENSSNQKFAYLAVSDYLNWTPIDWGSITGKAANFSKIVKDVVYLPMLISNSGKRDYINYPFIINKNDSLHYLKPDFKKLQTIQLTRKYPFRVATKGYVESMINGKFQVSNDKNFKNAITLYTINKDPGVLHNLEDVVCKGNYRYVRYLIENKDRCGVAEIEFYTKDIEAPLKGKVMGAEGEQPIKNAFDGDVLTYIDAQKKKAYWVGLDLGEPTQISKIGFVSRNDQNHIVKENSYELFYWDNEWKSLGGKTATTNEVIYKKVPSNCLFLLRNRTEGKEERIFTYDRGQQIWR